jgi:hypothetical protein
LAPISEASVITEQLAIGTLALLQSERSHATDAIVMYGSQ